MSALFVDRWNDRGIDDLRKRPRAEFAVGITVLLIPAECQFARNVERSAPAAIAARRPVTIETTQSQIKRIYAQAEVAGSIEFVAKARR